MSMASIKSKKDNDNTISHYQLIDPLVVQTISAIYLAQDEKTDSKVFLVTLQPEAARSSDLVERFQRRAETLSQLDHPLFPPLLDFGVDGKRPYAVMAHVAGDFLAAQLENSAPPPPDDKAKIIEALNLVKQIAAGFAVSHPNGLIHHDLRPENIYLSKTGQPHLLDLAVPSTPPAAVQLEEAPLTELDYQSPEQLTGKALSGRSNIYSLGILLYRLLAGQQPALPVSEWDIFEHKGMAREQPLNQVRQDLAAATFTAVQDSIWQKEWSRYETVDAQIAALDQAIAEESAPPPPPPPVWLLLLNRLRQPKVLKFAIPALVFLLLLFLVLMLMRGRANRQGNNSTPTPDAAALPLEIETAVLIDQDNLPANSPTAITIEATTATRLDEDEVLPPTEEVETPTVRPSPTETAVVATPTESISILTATPTLEITTTASPAAEPTEESCVPSPPFGWVRYSVQANDSLSSISQAGNTTVERLQEVNCLETILLSIGQEIWVPAPPEPVATATEQATAVPPGDEPTAVPQPTTPPNPPTPTPPNAPSP